MSALTTVVVVVAVLALLGFALSVRIVKQYERGVLFRLGRVLGVREPGLTLIVPAAEMPATDAAFNTDYNGAPAARP
jgi:regulator of protease activity HflC (stomatin/prohibitin superfamily)